MMNKEVGFGGNLNGIRGEVTNGVYDIAWKCTVRTEIIIVDEAYQF